MHVEINAQFEFDVDTDITLLAALGEFITEQNIPSVLVEAIVESLDEQLVEAYCGEKHAHGNGEERFQRTATKTRSVVITAGDHEFSLTYVEDTAADQDDQSCFCPIEDLTSFDSQRQYQEDISVESADLATSLSYRDATKTLIRSLNTTRMRTHRRHSGGRERKWTGSKRKSIIKEQY